MGFTADEKHENELRSYEINAHPTDSHPKAFITNLSLQRTLVSLQTN